jgi:hypothetical protein
MPNNSQKRTSKEGSAVNQFMILSRRVRPNKGIRMAAIIDSQPSTLKTTGNRASGAAKINKAPNRSRTMTAAYIPQDFPQIDFTFSINLFGAYMPRAHTTQVAAPNRKIMTLEIVAIIIA